MGFYPARQAVRLRQLGDLRRASSQDAGPRRPLSKHKPASPFRYFNSSPEVIRLVVLMYVRFPLSLRNVEDLLSERGIDICHETVRQWWNRFGPMSLLKSLQKFASVHSSLQPFSSERNLVNRETYRERCSAALAEWQSLAA